MNFDLFLTQLAAMRNQIDAMMEVVDMERVASGLESGLHGPTGTNEATHDDEQACTHPAELENGANGRIDIGTLATGERYQCRSCGEVIEIKTHDDLPGSQGHLDTEPAESEAGAAVAD